MEKWKIDVPVLLIFFARPKELQKVFDSIRQAKPSTLLLWQDGPRENRPDDIENIEKCRKIAENIDWECTVYKNYQEKNLGCDPSTFLSHKWAFSIVDKCIIMEDDRIPDQSFYRFCKELLDYYENDTRISHICGTNLLENYDACDGDYLFASHGSTTWASWRRVAEQWEEDYAFLNNEYAISCLKRDMPKEEFAIAYGNAVRHSKIGKQFWESILGMSCLLNHQVAIIPAKNLVCDIGMSENATHALAEEKYVSKYQRNMFNMKAYEVSFPIKHPKYIVIDRNYEKEINKFSGLGYPFLKLKFTTERAIRYILNGDVKRLVAGFKNRIKRSK